MKRDTRFQRGDYIEVRPIERGQAQPAVSGTALDTMHFSGYSDFQVRMPGGDLHKYNLNQVEVEVLFSADVARELRPLPELDEDVASVIIFGMMWNVIDSDATLGSIQEASKAALREILLHIEANRG